MFIERMLRSLIRRRALATVSLDELEQRGYDVTTFVESLGAYASLAAKQKNFVVSVVQNEVRIRRARADGAP